MWEMAMTTHGFYGRWTRIGGFLAAGLMALAIAGCNGGSQGNGLPHITALSVSTATAGSPDLPLKVSGVNFDVEGHKRTWVVWRARGADTFLGSAVSSNSKIDVTIPAALLATPGMAQVYAINYDAMGEEPLAPRNPVQFIVTEPTPAPATAIALSPAVASAGSPDLALRVTGENFDIEGHKRTWVVWRAHDVDTLLGSAGSSTTEIDVTVPAAQLASAGIALVYVATFDPMDEQPILRNPTTFTIIPAAETAIEFEPAGAMSVGRAGHTATRLADGQVLIAGGGDASAELFDPADGVFVPTGGLTGTGSGIAAVLLDTGRVLIAGGSGLATETYDPGTGVFQPSGTLNALHVAPTASLLPDGRVLVAGGTDGISTKGLAIATAEVFDPRSGTSVPISPMSSARAGHAAAALADGKVLVAGGRNGYAPDSLDDPPWDPMFDEIFDPVAGRFATTGSTSTTRVGGDVVALPDGRALVLGGFGSYFQNQHEQPASPAFAEVYSASTGEFAALSTPRVVERAFTATLLPDGRVLLIGGVDAGRVLDTVWLLDPATGAITEAGHLGAARQGHTATLLADGRVLVTGGYDADGNVLASAEVARLLEP